jgi:hypothetical protein
VVSPARSAVSGEPVIDIPLDTRVRKRYGNPYSVTHRADTHRSLLDGPIELTCEFRTDDDISSVCCRASVKFFDGRACAILLVRLRQPFDGSIPPSKLPMIAKHHADPLLPSGTVTFLFTDIEGSTKLWETQRAAMQIALARHDALLRQIIERHHGHVVKSSGDGACAVFASATDALEAAVAAQQALAGPRGLIQTRLLAC